MSDSPGNPLTPLTEEEKLEMTCLFFEDRKEFRKVLTELFNKYAMRELFDYGGIQERVKSSFDSMVAAIVNEGFGVNTRSYDRTYTGPWADKVRELVQESIRAHIEKYDPKKDVWTAQQLQNLRRAWVAEYKLTFERAVRRHAEKQASADANKFVEELLGKHGL